MILEKIEEKLNEYRQLREDKASKRAVLELKLNELEEKRNEIQQEINANLWENSKEKVEFDRLIIVKEELSKLEQ